MNQLFDDTANGWPRRQGGLSERGRALIVLLAVTLVVPLSSQPSGTPASIYHARLARAVGWQERSAAFYSLLASVPNADRAHPWIVLKQVLASDPVNADRLTIDLIAALQTEATWVKAQSDVSEGFGSYEGDLIAAVASIEDRRAVPALFLVIDTGNMAVSALASSGDEALSRALVALKEVNEEGMRHSLMILLARIAQPENLLNVKSLDLKAQMNSALVNGLTDQSQFVRGTAIAGLVSLGDPDVIPALAVVARSDPFTSSAGRGAGRYVLREQAQDALRKLSERQTNTLPQGPK
jgi:hypothetical protein